MNMNIEEALEWSKEMLKQCKDTNEKYILFKGKYINATDYMTIVTEALEKQTLKKPIDNCYCPVCGRVVYTMSFAKKCCDCGQKILWEE